MVDLPRVGGRAAGVDGVTGHRREIDVADVEMQLAGGDARHVEQVLHELGLGVRVAVDAIDGVPPFVLRQVAACAAGAPSRRWR